jgi:CHAD domain-containing protein
VSEVDANPNDVSLVHTDLVKSRFEQRVSDLASAAARVQGAEDPEAVHDLRVSARSLDAMLRAWAGLLGARPRSAARRALRRLRRRLGDVRELETHVTLLERTASDHGEPATELLTRLRGRLSRRTARAGRRLRPRRLRRLMERVHAATSSLDSGLTSVPHVLDRARAHVLEMRVVAHAAVEVALTREDDWLVHQARLAVKKWRYAVESVDPPANGTPHDLRPTLRLVQEVLGIVQDRAALIDAVERFGRKRARPGLQALIEELKAEKQAAYRRFQALAGALGIKSPRAAAAIRAVVRPGENSPAGAAAISTDERWEHMAQWLLGKSTER